MFDEILLFDRGSKRHALEDVGEEEAGRSGVDVGRFLPHCVGLAVSLLASE